MKAAICTRYGAPEVLEIQEVPQPQPKPKEVLVRVKASTVAMADFRVRSFTIPLSFWLPARLMLGITKPRHPILGVELSGVIEAVGADVTRFQVGDEVLAATLNNMGGYGEYCCLPEDGPLVKKPKELSFAQAAALPVGGRAALNYIRKVPDMKGKKVLLYGASGSVGSYYVQLAHYYGAEVTAVCSASNHEWVKAFGAEKVLDYRDPNWRDQLEVYDVVMVAVAKIDFATCNRVLKPDGYYLDVTIPVPSFSMLWTKWTTKKTVVPGENSRETPEELSFLAKMVAEEDLHVKIDRTYSLDNIVEAHRYVDQGHKKGNVVILVDEVQEPVQL